VWRPQYRPYSLLCPHPIGDDAAYDVCLSVAYIGPKSRTERPRQTKIGTEVAQVTRDSDTIFKVKTSKFKVTAGGGILRRPPAQLVLTERLSNSHWIPYGMLKRLQSITACCQKLAY